MNTLVLAASSVAADADSLFRLLITVLVAGLIFWLLTWAVTAIGIPEPFAKVIKAVIIIVAVLFLVRLLLGLL